MSSHRFLNSPRFSLPAVCGSVLLISSAVHAGSSTIFTGPGFYSNDYAVTAGDFDGDNDIDLITSDPPSYDGFGILIDPGDLTLNVNGGNGDPPFMHDSVDPNQGYLYLTSADLNGDGIPDLIDNGTGVRLSNGDGTFGPRASYGGGGVAAVGDMNGDDIPDIVRGTGGRVLLNNGDGTFYTNFVGSNAIGGASVALGDLNEDGALDIVATTAYYNPDRHYVQMQLNLNDGNGNPGPSSNINIGGGGSPIAVALTDLNGDGHLDLITMNNGTEDLSVVLGNGDGTFGAGTEYAVHNASYFEPRILVVADVNNDGVDDAFVESTVYGAGTSHQDISVLLSDGNGALSVAQIIPDVESYAHPMVAADIDGDGDMDVASATHIFYNQTDPIPNNPADINGDHVVDVTDLFMLLSAWGGCPAAPAQCSADLDASGAVDVTDLFMLLSAWG